MTIAAAAHRVEYDVHPTVAHVKPLVSKQHAVEYNRVVGEVTQQLGLPKSVTDVLKISHPRTAGRSNKTLSDDPSVLIGRTAPVTVAAARELAHKDTLAALQEFTEKHLIEAPLHSGESSVLQSMHAELERQAKAYENDLPENASVAEKSIRADDDNDQVQPMETTMSPFTVRALRAIAVELFFKQPQHAMKQSDALAVFTMRALAAALHQTDHHVQENMAGVHDHLSAIRRAIAEVHARLGNNDGSYQATVKTVATLQHTVLNLGQAAQRSTASLAHLMNTMPTVQGEIDEMFQGLQTERRQRIAEDGLHQRAIEGLRRDVRELQHHSEPNAEYGRKLQQLRLDHSGAHQILDEKIAELNSAQQESQLNFARELAHLKSTNAVALRQMDQVHIDTVRQMQHAGKGILEKADGMVKAQQTQNAHHVTLVNNLLAQNRDEMRLLGVSVVNSDQIVKTTLNTASSKYAELLERGDKQAREISSLKQEIAQLRAAQAPRGHGSSPAADKARAASPRAIPRGSKYSARASSSMASNETMLRSAESMTSIKSWVSVQRGYDSDV